MRRTLLAMLTVVLAGLVLAACPGDGAADRIEVTGTDALRFEPDQFTVAGGEEVTVELTAQEGAPHDFIIEDANGDVEVTHAEAGETATGTFTLDEPGTYTVYCGVPGHREAGMEGTLEVTESG